MVDRQCRESEGKVKIEGYMSVSDEEAHQCLHVDGFFEHHIKVHTLDVNMVDLPILGCGICQYDTHGGYFGCR